MNYKLEHIYKDMRLNQLSVSPTPSKPRTLTEAYKIINERSTVFVSKEGDSYYEIGSVESEEDAQKIKNNIRSHSITSLTSSLLEKAGWNKKNSLISPLKLGTYIFLHKIDIKDFAKINKNRERNTYFEDYIFSEHGLTTFNIVDIITKGIEKSIEKNQKTSTNDIKEMLDKLIKIKGDVDGTGVGPGELAISIFTNSTKGSEGQKGDLHFNRGEVEVKGSSSAGSNTSGAKLGYANYATSGKLEEAIDSLLEETTVTIDRDVHKKKAKYEDAVDTLKEVFSALPAAVPIKSAFYEKLKTLSNDFLAKSSEEIQKRLQDEFNIILKPGPLHNTQLNNIIDFLHKKGYLEKGTSYTSVYINDIDKQLKEILKNYLYGSSSDFIRTLKQLLHQSPGTKTLKTSNLNEKFKNLFLSDLGFNAKQLAEVLIEARPTQTLSVSVNEIKDRLEQGYLQKLKRGDTQALNALVFALHLKCYAGTEKFDRLLLINQTTHNSIVVPTHKSFKDLVDFYENNSKDLVFSITFINTRGAHTLGIK